MPLAPMKMMPHGAIQQRPGSQVCLDPCVQYQFTHYISLSDKTKRLFETRHDNNMCQGTTVRRGVKGRVGLRDDYHNHIQEACERLRQENPGLTRQAALVEARKERMPQCDQTLYKPVLMFWLDSSCFVPAKLKTL